MSLNITIDTSQKVVVATLRGEIKDADLIDIAALTKGHPLFDPSFSEIVDFSGVTGGKISTFAVQTLAQRASIYHRTSKHVVIAPQAHGFGLTRMYQVYARETRPNMEVVHTLEEAYKCLGLDRGAREPH